MLNVQRTFTQAFVVDEAGKWYERIARMFCFDLVIHQLSSPTVFPVKARAPSVVALAILFHSHPVLAMQFSTAWNTSLPVVVFFRESTQSISSLSSKLASVPRINTNNCAVSCTSVLSSNASEYHKNCLLVSFSWLMRSSLVFSTCLTTVLLDKAMLSILVFCSGHMILATSNMHSLINSPSENGFFLFESLKLASVAAACMIDCLVKTLLFLQRVH